MVKSIFENFEGVLGKTGAAKCLHLLAPRFFPLWDTKIAIAYKVAKGNEAECYCNFMKIAREQCKCLGGEKAIGRNPLKALDEYNYLMFTLSELDRRRNIRHKMENQKVKPRE
jgi:hypothetical protein